MNNELAMQFKRQAGPMRRLVFAFLALFSPDRLVMAILSGFLSAIESLDDDQLKELVKDLKS